VSANLIRRLRTRVSCGALRRHGDRPSGSGWLGAPHNDSLWNSTWALVRDQPGASSCRRRARSAVTTTAPRAARTDLTRERGSNADLLGDHALTAGHHMLIADHTDGPPEPRGRSALSPWVAFASASAALHVARCRQAPPDAKYGLRIEIEHRTRCIRRSTASPSLHLTRTNP